MSSAPTSVAVAGSSTSGKRPNDGEAKAGRNYAKRQKQNAQKKRDVKRDGAVRVWNAVWTKKADAMTAWRHMLLQHSGSSSLKLIQTLNEVRKADCRPELVQKQLELLASKNEIHQLLLDIYTSPLFWSAESYGEILEKSTFTAAKELEKLEASKRHAPADQMQIDDEEEDVAVDSGYVGMSSIQEDGAAADEDEDEDEEEDEDALDDSAQFYIRRLSFANHSALSDLLAVVKKNRPQYAGHIDMLVASSATEVAGQRWLSYGGYTIATSVIGRQKDDSKDDHQGSFLKAVLEQYVGQVEIFEVLPLRFHVGEGGHHSVMYGRNDERTTLFESLVVDCWGFACLNTAPPGLGMEMALDAETLAGKKAVAEAEYTAEAMSEEFAWLKIDEKKKEA